jgi:hypothetical protein
VQQLHLSDRQKKPQHRAGVVSLFAVTHQGPAQGGKAGDSKLSGVEYSKAESLVQGGNRFYAQIVTKIELAGTDLSPA